MPEVRAAKTQHALSLILALAVLFVGILLARTRLETGPDCPQAIARTGMARDLFRRDLRGEIVSDGYHNLMNSAAVSPLGTLAALPFAWSDGRLGSGAGCLLLDSVLASLCVLYGFALARRLGMPGLVGAAAMVGVLFNPWRPLGPGGPAAGTGAAGTLLFATAACAHFAGWLRGRRMLALALAANVLAFGLLWDARLAALALLGLGLVVGRTLFGSPTEEQATAEAEYRAPNAETGRGRRLEALLQVYLVPLVFIPGIWVLFNWLIFGDPLHLLSDLPEFFVSQMAALSVLGGVAGIAAMAMGSRRWLACLGLAAAYVACVAGLAWQSTGAPALAEAMFYGAPGVSIAERGDLRELERHLLETSGGRLVVVLDLAGYQVRSRLGDIAGLEHYFNADLMQVERKTRGREVFVVMNRQQEAQWRARLGGDTAWDDRFLEEGRFGQWAVFRLVKPLYPLAAQS
jgi:hypothetical protein